MKEFLKILISKILNKATEITNLLTATLTTDH